jgi:hypothetical protein
LSFIELALPRTPSAVLSFFAVDHLKYLTVFVEEELAVRSLLRDLYGCPLC